MREKRNFSHNCMLWSRQSGEFLLKVVGRNLSCMLCGIVLGVLEIGLLFVC